MARVTVSAIGLAVQSHANHQSGGLKYFGVCARPAQVADFDVFEEAAFDRLLDVFFFVFVEVEVEVGREIVRML